ncbi:HEPN domain-containing protein [Paenibacillus sp. P96]|uniref:HEPN domain-containing protein n=1 Tax=Paenibacillus zeirhizosphaerae TaxID=2987519 RepID=A0ABT9FWW5_9BACL|nr:HEPN domain-containing protein [Paenibacillus sp. P96]MDP4099125.1 HEPN domain-containing protein [Paenibacillus sp. P96]
MGEDIRIANMQYVHPEILYFHNAAHYHLKLALIFLDRNQLDPVVILCDRALTSMLKALYIQENNTLSPPSTFSMEELLYLLHTEADPALDVVIFIGTIQYLTSQLERERISKMKKKDIKRLLRRTDEILCLLSPRIMDDPAEVYCTIF